MCYNIQNYSKIKTLRKGIMPEENPTPNAPSAQNTTDASNTQSTSDTPTSPTPYTTPATSPAEPIQNTPETPSSPTTAPTITPDDTPTPMSSPILKSKVHKPKNKLLPVVLILVVLALAGLGVSIFAFAQISNKDSEIARLRSDLANQGVILPTTPDDDNNNPSDDQPTITPAIRAEVLSAVPGSLVLSDAKNLNTSYDMLYSISDSFGSDGTASLPAFSAGLSLSTNLSSLTLNWDRVKELYPNLHITKTDVEEFTDLGLSGKPTDLLLTGFGQAVGEETLFFIMADGTVEYIPLAKAVQENKIKSYGKLPNVNNVIKFYDGSSCPAEGYTGCGHQSLAQRADGNYYELYDAVKITGNFDVQTH